MKTNIMAYTLLIIGFGCIVAAIFLFTNKKQSSPSLSKIAATPPPPADNKEKGNQFEHYVVRQLVQLQAEVKLLSKSSDYHQGGVSAEDNREPDLKLSFKGTPFAVECKWRASFKNNHLQWAENYQLKNYQNYAQKSGQKVFIALGVGGSPAAPKSFYLIPLYVLKYENVKMDYIRPWKMETTEAITAFLNKL